MRVRRPVKVFIYGLICEKYSCEAVPDMDLFYCLTSQRTRNVIIIESTICVLGISTLTTGCHQIGADKLDTAVK